MSNDYAISDFCWLSLKEPGRNLRVTNLRNKYVLGELVDLKAVGLWTLHTLNGGIREQTIFI